MLNVTIESICDSIFGLSYIFDQTPVAFKTIYEIVPLTIVIVIVNQLLCNCILGFVIVEFFNFP